MLHSGFPRVVPTSAALLTPSSIRMLAIALRDRLLARVRTPPRSRLPRQHAFHYKHVLGTSFELQVVAIDTFAAQRAEAATLREIDRLSSLLSTHDVKKRTVTLVEARY